MNRHSQPVNPPDPDKGGGLSRFEWGCTIVALAIALALIVLFAADTLRWVS